MCLYTLIIKVNYTTKATTFIAFVEVFIMFAAKSQWKVAFSLFQKKSDWSIPGL